MLIKNKSKKGKRKSKCLSQKEDFKVQEKKKKR